MSGVAPYGAWISPITAAMVGAREVPLREPRIVGGDIYWLEGKPLEGGRVALMHRAAGGECTELTPAPFDVRTRAHEYGGGAYALHGSTVFFSNFVDQRVYRRDADGACRPITNEPAVPAGDRFADGVVTADGRLLVCVRERHMADGSEPIGEIVAVPTDGAAPPKVIASGRDFFAAPRLGPDGRRLAWLAWDHPAMPWDASELWTADIANDGALSQMRCVAGGAGESIFQPEWSPDGVLHWVSDRSGWWNLYRLSGDTPEALTPMDAELGAPQWTFGLSRYAFLADGRIACIYSREAIEHLAFLRPGAPIARVDTPFTAFEATLRSSGNTIVFVAGSIAHAQALILMDAATGRSEVVRRSIDHEVEPGYVSEPRPITFPSADGRTAHGLYYGPSNPDYTGPSGERPPLLVYSHGGPTSQARAQFALERLFWTSRGFAIVDVNYSGSSGYGRAYRERLAGKWGIVDVEDCVNAARYLEAQGMVDGRRLAIRGGSAGGYTALCALVFHDVFAAGSSYYGVGDCESLAKATHKFESRYLDTLIGPYPAARDVYYQRSPVHFAHRLSCPVILFQGLEDRVVPPSQAEAIVSALRARHVPVAYVTFEGEYHGFRKAETIRRALEAELYFYTRVFGVQLTERVEPIEIENLSEAHPRSVRG